MAQTAPDFRLDLSSISFLPEFPSHPKLYGSTAIRLWLSLQHDLLAWTFTITKETFDTLRIKHCIAGLRPKFKSPRLRVAANSHTKCFIGKNSMLVGSFNLSEHVHEDLCVLISNPGILCHMRKQFYTHWNLLK